MIQSPNGLSTGSFFWLALRAQELQLTPMHFSSHARYLVRKGLLLLAFGAPRELAALTAAIDGGISLILVVSPAGHGRGRDTWAPLLAVYAPSVLRGARPQCVTQISVDEFERLGPEGFGTVVGKPRPGATFGLFVDDHLVWPRTPPRAAHDGDPGFGSA